LLLLQLLLLRPSQHCVSCLDWLLKLTLAVCIAAVGLLWLDCASVGVVDGDLLGLIRVPSEVTAAVVCRGRNSNSNAMVLVIALLLLLSFIVCERLLVIGQRLRAVGCPLLDLLGGFDLNIWDGA